MKEFTYQQKISMMRILLDIMDADGKIDIREMALFNKMTEIFELESFAKSDVDNKLSLLALTTIKDMDEEQKKFFAQTMHNMIVADEDVNVNEVTVYNVVKDYCGIPVDFTE